MSGIQADLQSALWGGKSRPRTPMDRFSDRSSVRCVPWEGQVGARSFLGSRRCRQRKKWRVLAILTDDNWTAFGQTHSLEAQR